MKVVSTQPSKSMLPEHKEDIKDATADALKQARSPVFKH